MTTPAPKELRALLRALAAHVKPTNRGLELAGDAYAMAESLYSEGDKTHCLMMATRTGLECADFADLLRQQGAQMVEFWLDAREA